MSGIYIPEPCHENWNSMTPTEKGRFCAVCTKEVMDFTRKSNEEIITHLQQAEEKTCGQFLVTQLEPAAQTYLSKNPWEYRWKKAMISVLAFIGVFGLNKNAKAQQKGKVAIRGDVAYTEIHNTNSKPTTISGQIKDENGNPLSGVNVDVYSNDEKIGSLATRANGTYTIELAPGKIMNNKITIEASHYSYETKRVEDLQITKSNHRVNFNMGEMYMILGEIAWFPNDTVQEEIVPVETVDTLIEMVPEKICVLTVDTTTLQENTTKDSVVSIQEETVIPADENKGRQQEATTTVSPEVREEDINGKLYPNPGKERVNLVMNEKATYYIEVIDLSGQTVSASQFSGAMHILDVSHYAPGIYIVKYQEKESGKTGSLRLVKE